VLHSQTWLLPKLWHRFYVITICPHGTQHWAWHADHVWCLLTGYRIPDSMALCGPLLFLSHPTLFSPAHHSLNMFVMAPRLQGRKTYKGF
jgi:hypothetical protein